MIAELRKSHRAVLCRRCHEPIPVGLTVVSLQDEIENRERSTAFSFSARCRVCEDESVYAVDAVQSVEGEPRMRVMKSWAAKA